MKTLSVLCLILLAGCSTAKVDPSLLEPCTSSPPPLLVGEDKQDIKSISSAWMEQTSNLGKCNDQLTKIRDVLKGEK